MYNIVVVGSGLSGAVVAREFAEANYKVFVIEKRDHIGGNVYDEIRHGIRISKYGPHFFHTNDANVWDYVNKFSEWIPWEHKVLAHIQEDQFVSVPVNQNTIRKLFDVSIQNETDMIQFLDNEKVPIQNVVSCEDYGLSTVGKRIYDTLFRGYTTKQWGKSPSEIDRSVLARLPIRFNNDDRYFTDTFQALPKFGYTHFVNSILNHPNIQVETSCDYFSVDQCFRNVEKTFFTGRIDKYFGSHGLDALEYRSLKFEEEIHVLDNPEKTILPASVVTFPNINVPWTRITEYKHLWNQKADKSILVKEYSCSEGEPYYPVPTKRNMDLYQKYVQLSETYAKNTYFLGRLAGYKYYNMDQAIYHALEISRNEIK